MSRDEYRGVLIDHDGHVRFLGDDGFPIDPADLPLTEDEQDEDE